VVNAFYFLLSFLNATPSNLGNAIFNKQTGSCSLLKQTIQNAFQTNKMRVTRLAATI